MPFKISRTQITEGFRRKDRPKKKQSFNPKNPEVDDKGKLTSKLIDKLTV